MTENTLDELIGREFPIIQSLHHLNHAAVGPWPTRTADAVKAFADENLAMGSRNYPHWMQVEQQLRQRLARFIDAPSVNDIALVKNTSEGLSMIAHGFPWQSGDNVVISDQEFPSNRIVWESLADRGVEVRQVALPCSGDIEQALLSACDARTRMISISAVEYGSGLRVDLKTLGALCAENNIAFCVDAIQALGAVPVDVTDCKIDFLVADGHKWLLSSEGLAIFYCSSKWRDRMALYEYGWRMVDDPTNFDQKEWKPAASGARFECGSPNMLGIHALNASLELIMEIGIGVIEQELLKRTAYLFDRIKRESDLTLLTCEQPGRFAGITVFSNSRYSNETLFQRLNESKVLCAIRGGGIRLSPHFYIPMSSLDHAIDVATL
jgi:selenocysteine lyase/cysteine desulfurase